MSRCRYNKALRDGDLEGIERWRDFSLVFDSGLSKLPAQACTVYRSEPRPFNFSFIRPRIVLRGLDCPLTEVSHLYVEGCIVWFNSVTSTTTDKDETLATFGAGASGIAGTFMEMRVRNARKVRAFSAFAIEHELLLAPNTCTKVLVTLSSAKVALLQGFAKLQLPPDVDLIVLEVVG